MRIQHVATISLVALFGNLIPARTMAADLAPNTSAITISQIQPASIRVAGTAAGTRTLQAVVYAMFAPDLPTVLLSRWPITADAAGHYSATIPIAPAFFEGTVITVVMQNANAVSIGRASVTLVAPTVPDVHPN